MILSTKRPPAPLRAGQLAPCLRFGRSVAAQSRAANAHVSLSPAARAPLRFSPERCGQILGYHLLLWVSRLPTRSRLRFGRSALRPNHEPPSHDKVGLETTRSSCADSYEIAPCIRVSRSVNSFPSALRPQTSQSTDESASRTRLSSNAETACTRRQLSPGVHLALRRAIRAMSALLPQRPRQRKRFNTRIRGAPNNSRRGCAVAAESQPHDERVAAFQCNDGPLLSSELLASTSRNHATTVYEISLRD